MSTEQQEHKGRARPESYTHATCESPRGERQGGAAEAGRGGQDHLDQRAGWLTILVMGQCVASGRQGKVLALTGGQPGRPGSVEMLMAMVVTAVVSSVSLIVAPFALLLMLLLLAVVSKVQVAVAMTHDQMRSEGGITVDTCLVTTSSSLSSPSVLSLTPPSKPTLTSPLTISLLTPLLSQNNTKEHLYDYLLVTK